MQKQVRKVDPLELMEIMNYPAIELFSAAEHAHFLSQTWVLDKSQRNPKHRGVRPCRYWSAGYHDDGVVIPANDYGYAASDIDIATTTCSYTCGVQLGIPVSGSRLRLSIPPGVDTTAMVRRVAVTT